MMKKFSFSFKPNKLIKVKEEVKRNFPTKKEINKLNKKKAEEIDIDELLNRIRNTEKSQMKYLANDFNKYEAISLVSNYDKIPDDLLSKSNEIIKYKMNKRLLTILWQLFADDYKNINLIKLINSSLNQLTTNSYIELLREIFQNNMPLDNINQLIEVKETNYFAFLEKINIIPEKELAQKIALDLFTKEDKYYFKREKVENLIKLQSNLKKHAISKIAENYLLLYEVDNFKEEMMIFYQNKLGDPREDYSTAWDKINKNAKEKAVSWLNYKKLKDFFGYIETDQEEARKRFSYWESYVSDIKKVNYVKKYLQLFLIFEDFVVVEFGDLGNAVYFYSKDFFDEELARYMNESNAKNNNNLKYTYEARERRYKYVEKVDHRNKWELKADNMIKEFKSGRR